MEMWVHCDDGCHCGIVCGCWLDVWSIIIAAHRRLVDTDASSGVMVTLRYHYIAIRLCSRVMNDCTVKGWWRIMRKVSTTASSNSEQSSSTMTSHDVALSSHRCAPISPVYFLLSIWKRICCRALRSVTTAPKTTLIVGGVERHLRWSQRAMYYYPFCNESEFGYSNRTRKVETETTCWPEPSRQRGNRRKVRRRGSS